MPDDEQAQETQAAAETIPGDPVEQDPAPQEGDTPATPPAIPYVRFKEVNDRAKAADERATKAEAKIAEIEQRLAQPQPAAQPQPVTMEQVFAAYERGQITESQKDQWVMHLTKESAKAEFGQAITQAATMMRANTVVSDYAKTYPAVNDTASSEWKALAATYQELLSRGYPANVTTQADALRMTFGPLKAKSVSTPEHTRARADTFLEGAGGGSAMPTHDPLKEIPDRQKQYWQKKGYTKAQMTHEARMAGVSNYADYKRLKAKAK